MISFVVISGAQQSSLAQNLLPAQWAYNPLSQVNSVAYSPDDKLIAAGGPGGLQIYSAATGQPLGGFPTRATRINSVAFSPDGKSLADGGSGVNSNGNQIGVVETWNIATGARIYSFGTKTTTVSAVAFSPDSRTLADGSHDGVLETWNAVTGKGIMSLQLTGPSNTILNVNAVAFSPDGKTLVDGAGYNNGISVGGVAELRKAATGVLVSTVHSAAVAGVSCLAYSPDGKTLGTGGGDGPSPGGVVELWNVANVASPTIIKSLTTTANNIYTLAFSPDGTKFVDGGGSNVSTGVLERWNVTNPGTPTLSYSLSTSAVIVHSTVFTADSKQLTDVGVGLYANGANFGVLETWNASNGTQIDTINTAITATVSAVAISPAQGAVLATAGYSDSNGADNSVLALWDAVSGNLLATLNSEGTSLSTVVYSPDGKSLADGGQGNPSVGSGGVLEIWNLSTATVTELNTTASQVNSVAFSPDGKLLAVAGMNSQGPIVEIWTISSGTSVVLPSQNSGGCSAIGFTPDGKSIVDGGWISNGGDGQLEVWNASTLALIRRIDNGGTEVATLAFSPDGSFMADAGYNGNTNQQVVKIWHVSSWTSAATLNTALHNITSLTFSPDGKTIIDGGPAGSTGGLIEMWNTSSWAQRASYNTTSVQSVAVSPTGFQIVYGDAIGNLVAAAYPYPPAVAVKSITASPATLCPTMTTTFTVTLNQPAPSGGVTVNISSGSTSALTLSASTITIAAGQTSGTMTGTAQAVTTYPSVAATVNATYSGSSVSTPVTVEPWIKSVQIAPSSVTAGQTSTLTVTLNLAAPTGGLPVTLTSSNTAVAQVPSPLNIAAGATSATATVTTSAVTANTNVTLTATNGGASQSGTLTVTPNGSTLTLSPTTIMGGATGYGFVTLAAPAPTGGATVTISSGTPAVAWPVDAKGNKISSITIPAGATSGYFQIASATVTATTQVVFTVSYSGVSSNATLTVTPVTYGTLQFFPATVKGGSNAIGLITLYTAPTSAVTGTIKSGNTHALPDATVSFAAGQTTAVFNVNTTAVTSNANATITVTVNGKTVTGYLTITP
jgi:WD40 repeat protein